MTVVVTVFVQILVPAFKVTYLLPFLLTLCETFSGRDQRIGCALEWGTIARDSESKYPFYLVQDTYDLTNLSLSVTSVTKVGNVDLT